MTSPHPPPSHLPLRPLGNRLGLAPMPHLRLRGLRLLPRRRPRPRRLSPIGSRIPRGCGTGVTGATGVGRRHRVGGSTSDCREALAIEGPPLAHSHGCGAGALGKPIQPRLWRWLRRRLAVTGVVSDRCTCWPRKSHGPQKIRGAWLVRLPPPPSLVYPTALFLFTLASTLSPHPLPSSFYTPPN